MTESLRLVRRLRQRAEVTNDDMLFEAARELEAAQKRIAELEKYKEAYLMSLAQELEAQASEAKDG